MKLGSIQDIAYPPRSRCARWMARPTCRCARAAKIDVPIEVGTIKTSAEVEMTWRPYEYDAAVLLARAMSPEVRVRPNHLRSHCPPQVASHDVKLLTVAARASWTGRPRAARPAARGQADGRGRFPATRGRAAKRPEQTLIRSWREELGIVTRACLAPLKSPARLSGFSSADVRCVSPLATAVALEGQQLASWALNRYATTRCPPHG